MDLVTSAADGSGAVLFPIHGKMPAVPHSQSMERSFESYLTDGWIHRDQRYLGVKKMIACGVVSDFDILPVSEINRHAYYQEFLAPHGLRWFAGIKVESEDDLWALSIQRSIAQGPFSPEDLVSFADLSRSLSAAAALARTLGFSRIEAALSAFEISGSAAALLDRRGEVMRLNEAAERVLSPDLQVVQRRIHSFDRDATASLDRAIQMLLWRIDGPSLLPPVVLPRREGRPVLAYPSRLPSTAAGAFAPCQIAIVLVDLEARVGPGAADLMEAFKLTSSEARMAAALATGTSLTECAAMFHIAEDTARKRLKAIFAKTQTNRQGELVALLARLKAEP